MPLRVDRLRPIGDLSSVHHGARRILCLLPWRELLAALPGLVLMATALHYYADFVSDDAYISFRYAEHLAQGRGLEWNPGYRVEGFSNFLWVLLLGLLRWVGLAVPDAARLLVNLSCFGTVLLVVLGACRDREPRSYLLLALSPLPLVLSFPYQYWCALRLETAFFAFLLLGCPLLFAREERGARGPRWGSAIAYLALAMTRPEGAAFLVVPGVVLLSRVRSLAQLRTVLRERLAWLLILVVGLALYEAFRLWTFGDPLPNTYYAKVGSPDDLERGLIYLKRFFYERPYHFVILTAVLLLGGAGRTAGALLFGTALTLCAVVVVEGGDWMREWRLLQPLMPLLVGMLAMALQQRLASEPRASRAAGALGLLLLGFGVQHSMGTPLDEWRLAFRGERRNLLINFEGEMTQVSRQVGLWLRAHARPTDLVAVNHAGAVPFYSGLPTLDMVGLNDRHIARLPGTRHGKFDADYVLARKPRFVVLNTRTLPVNGLYVPGYWPGETALWEHPEFRRRYRPAAPHWTWRHTPVSHRDQPLVFEAYILVYRRDESRYRALSCLDFESGTYRGWRVIQGRAFGSRPASGPQGLQRAEGFQGRYFADSFPASDHPAGLLRSLPIRLRGNRLDFLVGGAGEATKAGVRLIVDGRIERVSTGRRDGRLRAESWDIAALAGRLAEIEVYDHGPGPWGHVMADHFCLVELREEGQPTGP